MSALFFVRLLLLFTLVPILELGLLVEVGRRLGTAPTLGLVALTGLGGAWLARREGLGVLRAMQRDLAQGELPAAGLVDAVLVLIGGLLLITPGFLTDGVGLALLVPPVRQAIRHRLRRALERAVLRGPVILLRRW
ncbi:MAG: FxsA family protein [bacterium]|nr:FxsA family protein [bacterium]